MLRFPERDQPGVKADKEGPADAERKHLELTEIDISVSSTFSGRTLIRRRKCIKGPQGPPFAVAGINEH